MSRMSPSASTKDFNLAIIGGGIAGLTLTLALHSRGIKVAIYEQAPKFGEIGAGVSFSPNAVQAMKICHKGIYLSFEKVCTRNQWPEKKNVWFDFLDAYGKEGEQLERSTLKFVVSNSLGQNGVHRATFLDELIKLVPEGIAHFGKRLKSLEQSGDGGSKCVIRFEDGSSVEADAVVGCDGIKSKTRQLMHGLDHPCAQPTYTYKYAYRGVVPMAQAIEAVGEERALNSCMHLGPNGHVLTFPVNHGETLNIVAFRTTDKPWQNPDKLTAPAHREDALKDFAGYSNDVKGLLKLTKENLDVWAIFDLGNNPPPSYTKGRVAIMGDAAHATSPHHGAGAGLCIEDGAVMAELLADENVNSSRNIEAVFSTFHEVRYERGQSLVQSSSRIGNVYEWRAEGIGNDFDKMEKEINQRNDVIGGEDVDVSEMCKEARKKLREKLGAL
jgi:salicylate hydroxylase